MKKMIILAGLLVTMLTGCGNTKAEADEVETKSVVDTVCDQAIEVSEEIVEEYNVYLYLTEDEFEEMKVNTITYLKENYIEEGLSEESIPEIIELISSVEYDTTFEACYDLESLMKDYLRILVKYELLPEECSNYTIDELYETIV